MDQPDMCSEDHMMKSIKQILITKMVQNLKKDMSLHI